MLLLVLFSNKIKCYLIPFTWLQCHPCGYETQTPVPISQQGQLGRELAEIRGQVPVLPMWEAGPESGWLCLNEGRGSIQWGRARTHMCRTGQDFAQGLW